MRFNYKFIGILLIASSALLISACKDSSREKEKKPLDSAAIKEQMLKINTQMVAVEDESINKFIESKGWKMTETGTGLRWMMLENGTGEKAKSDQVASIAYSLYLLSGKLLYSSDSLGVKSFKIGHGDVERGLDEGILLLKIGDKARFILPSHLAFGFQGDGQLVPRKASLLYEVKLIDLK